MLPLLWLAFATPPLAIAEPPVQVLQPEVAQRLVAPPRCIAARCATGEWQVQAMAAIPAGQRRLDAQDLPGAGARLRIPDKRRDWVRAQGSNARIGMQYGVQALESADSSLRLAVDTGYRMQGYADNGMAGTGAIVRGRMEWRQALGERARLSQDTQLETGQHGTYMRNQLRLNLQLKPDVSLSTGVDLRRDSAVRGRNQTDATVNLRYVF